MYLSNEMTDAEALKIVEGELRKLSTADMIKVAAGDLTPLSQTIKNSVRQICVEGAKKEAVNYIPYIAGGAAGLLLLYLILK